MVRAYDISKNKKNRKESVPWSVLLLVLVAGVFILLSFFMMGAHDRLRTDLIDVLRKERQVLETNNTLKLELSALTQTRLLELKAKERLGLKKPAEEEVLVLK